MDKKMTTSKNGLELIKLKEGLYLESYKCPAGVWTIGYGHTGKVRGQEIGQFTKITKAEASDYLRQDVRKFENHVNAVIQRQLNQNEFDALVSFTFNLGYVLKDASLLPSIEHPDSIAIIPVEIVPSLGKVYEFLKDDKDYLDIVPELDYQWLRWCNAGGKPLRGLYNRRKVELGLYKKDIEIGKQTELL